jgi:hypothetical protein
VNRAGDRREDARTGTELGDTSECLARTLGATQPVESTILESDWTADMDTFPTAEMLLPGRRHFKHVDIDREFTVDT